jgi:tetratricopeptide (TPR) repeat protein
MFVTGGLCKLFLPMSETDRLSMLAQFLEQNPGDAFARYGLAMEYSKAGQTEQALTEFGKLLQLHPDYTNGYFMAAQTLQRAGRTLEAKKMLESGIEAARRTGNKHALSEMSAMLDELGSE